MGEVFGPYNHNDWFQMKKLRENLTWYINNNLINEGYNKEKNIYLRIIKKDY